MPTLQSSGAISIGDIAGVMGGSQPHSLSEYYRGGGLVPSTKTVTVNEGPFGSLNNYHLSSGPLTNTIFWAGSQVTSGFSNGVTSVTVGGVTYYRGSEFYREGVFKQDDQIYYTVSRSYSSTVSINANVPISGQISLSNFYGAEKP